MALPKGIPLCTLALTALALSACGGQTSLTPASAPNVPAGGGGVTTSGNSQAASSQLPDGQAAAFSASPVSVLKRATSPIQHIVLIVQENRSFDYLFQGYPGANTQSYGTNSKGQQINLTQIPLEAKYDINHNFTAWDQAYDNGKMDGWDKEQLLGKGWQQYPNPQFGFVPPGEVTPYIDMANQYVLDDNMFASDIDGSFIAHQYLVAAQANREVNYPTGPWSCTGGSGDTIHQLTNKRVVTKTSVPVCENYQTVGDELDNAGVSWHTYSPRNALPSWNGYAAISHIYGGPDWSKDVSGQMAIFNDIKAGKLAGVTWVIPSLADSDHAGSNSKKGPAWVTSVVNAVGTSKFWDSTAIFVLWDDWGGWYDHVTPPQLDYDGLGFRVPMICIGPYALKGVVSHTQYEFGSLLRFVENNFGLAQLAASDTRATAADQGCMNYSQSPRKFTRIPAALSAEDFEKEAPSLEPTDNQ